MILLTMEDGGGGGNPCEGRYGDICGKLAMHEQRISDNVNWLNAVDKRSKNNDVRLDELTLKHELCASKTHINIKWMWITLSLLNIISPWLKDGATWLIRIIENIK